MQEFLTKLIMAQLEKLLTPEVIAHYEQEAKRYVIAALREVAKKTPESLDDKVVELVAKALGV